MEGNIPLQGWYPPTKVHSALTQNIATQIVTNSDSYLGNEVY
jgi:hypothetical protein